MQILESLQLAFGNEAPSYVIERQKTHSNPKKRVVIHEVVTKENNCICTKHVKFHLEKNYTNRWYII